jgi:hypothetical protein
VWPSFETHRFAMLLRMRSERKPMLRRPCSLSRPGEACLSRPSRTGGRGSRPPQKCEGMARRESASVGSSASSLLRMTRRLSARHRSVVTATGRAFSNHATEAWPAVSQLLAGGLIAPGRSPVTARGLGRSVRLPPAGAASCSANITPHDSALGRAGREDYGPILGIRSIAFRNILHHGLAPPSS